MGWDEALDDIAARLAAISARDPQAILPYSYGGTLGQVQGESMAARFFHRLGASLLDRTLCASAGAAALQATLGTRQGMRVEHFAESRLILVWGSNSISSNLHFWRRALEARRRGARLVCIDPRRSETADKCDEHLASRSTPTTPRRAASPTAPGCASSTIAAATIAWPASAAAPGRASSTGWASGGASTGWPAPMSTN